MPQIGCNQAESKQILIDFYSIHNASDIRTLSNCDNNFWYVAQGLTCSGICRWQPSGFISDADEYRRHFACMGCQFTINFEIAFPGETWRPSLQLIERAWREYSHTSRHHNLPRWMAWRYREESKFRNDSYVRAPWEKETWWIQSAASRSHFAHVSQHEAAKLSYTMNRAKGEADLQTRIKPGKYLKKYFGEGRQVFNALSMEYEKPEVPQAAILTDDAIAAWAAKWSQTFTQFTLNIETTPEGCGKVYMGDGPHSCMSDTSHTCDGVKRASTEVYGSPDCGVAWIAKLDGTGIRARGVVNRKDKTYVCLYGDPGQLETALKEAGYSQDDDALVGCRLLKIETDDGGYLLPYMDGARHCNSVDGYWVVTRGSGEVYAGDEYGAVNCGPICECCESRYPTDDGVYIGGEGQTWCESCAEDTFWCEHCDERHRDDNYGGGVSDESWCQTCVDSDAFSCDACGETKHDSESNEVKGGTYRVTWCDDCVGDKAMSCDRCDDTTDTEALKEVKDTDETPAVYCAECVSVYVVDCDGCSDQFDIDGLTPGEGVTRYCKECAEEIKEEKAAQFAKCVRELLIGIGG